MRVKVFSNFFYGADGLTNIINNFLEQIQEDYVLLSIEYTNDFTFIHYQKKPGHFPPTKRPILEPGGVVKGGLK